MPIHRSRSHLAWLRRSLLALLVLLVAGLGGLFWFGRPEKTVPPPPGRSSLPKAGKGVTLVGRDFDYTYSQGARSVFRIRGSSIRVDEQETLYLDGVGLTLYDVEDRSYHIESQEASFNRTSNEGRLRGSVRMQGPNDLTLQGSVVQMRENGELLTSPRPVAIGYAKEYEIQAQRMRAYLPEEVFVLEGDVTLRSVPGIEPPVYLYADHVVFERKTHQLRAEGKAELRRGSDIVRADRFSATLTEDEKSVSLVLARWNVSGQSGVEGKGSSVVRFRGEEVAVLVEQGQPRRVEIEAKRGPGGQRVSIETTGGGITRKLAALHLDATLQAGKLVAAQGSGGVEMIEVSAAGRRRALGKQAAASFQPDGQLGTLVLDQQVSYTDPQLKAAGDRGKMDFVTGLGEFAGAPARAETARGKMTAPRLNYQSKEGLVRAEGGVRAVLEKVEGTALAGSPLGAGKGPVQVQSQDAFWRQSPRGFLFRGDVRAWRDKSLLVARELQGEDEATAGQPSQHRLTASGGVKSLWYPEPREGAKPESGSPIEVTSASLLYQEARRLVTYSGEVRAEQSGKVLLCKDLDIELDAERKARAMTCRGEAKVNDPQTGRSIEGDRAVYQLAGRTVEITGSPGKPAVMKDRSKNQVRGQKMIYNLDTGRVEVLSQTPGQPADGGASPTP